MPAARGTRPSTPNLAVPINVVSPANGFKSVDDRQLSDSTIGGRGRHRAG